MSMYQKISAMFFLFFSITSIAGTPGGLNILMHAPDSSNNYTKEVDLFFNSNSNGNTVQCNERILLIDRYYSAKYKIKGVNDSLLYGSINNKSDRRKVQKILKEYSDEYIDGFDAIFFYIVDDNYVNFYMISPKVNYIASKQLLINDIDNEDKMREIVCDILIDVPVTGP